MKKTVLLSIATTILIALSILPIATVLTSSSTTSDGQGRAGTTLSANVNASAIYLTKYEWKIEKTANASEIYLSQRSPTATVEYNVSISKTTTVSYYIEGHVCVTNGGERATENLAITLDVYVKNTTGGWTIRIVNAYPVDVSGKPILDPGESYCYYYKVEIPNYYWSKEEFKATANVTITNHSGRLGTPFGPSPSTTTSKTSMIQGYDCVDVADTNGYSWSTCDSKSWTYVITFEYDPSKGESYKHNNTATIVQTDQSASWTVEVYQEFEVVQYATISGVVFWDNNYNGLYDEGDKPISGVAVDLYRYNETTGGWVYVNTTYSDEYGYYFDVEPGYIYKVVVSTPTCGSCDKIVNTTPTYYLVNVEEAKTYGDNDFGFVCLKMLAGARSKGYWSWSQYNRRTGQWQTRVTQEDVNYVNSELDTSFSSPKELADYLVNPVYGDMKTILMQQLIATLLNLRYGYISGDTVIYYNNMYITINDVVSGAKTALQSGTRYEQENWKNILDAVNNNNVYYVHTVDGC
ncbi:MAG: SdrD B-like domain-containing protein [Ignisphaera sp.]